jgi:hypothetical protein
MPQTDGPAPSPSYDDDEDEDEDDLEPVQGQLPRTAHPSLSVPAPGGAGGAQNGSNGGGAGARGGNGGGGGEEDDSAINSDLDDSDDEDDDAADEEGAPEGAIVFCTYDKVRCGALACCGTDAFNGVGWSETPRNADAQMPMSRRGGEIA